MLGRIKIGWAWLERTLNGMIDEVNLNRPLSSASIAIEQSPNGTVLRVVEKHDDSNKQKDTSQIQIKPVIWNNVTWATVTVVDPATCVTQNLQVVIQKPGSSITIQPGYSVAPPPPSP